MKSLWLVAALLAPATLPAVVHAADDVAIKRYCLVQVRNGEGAVIDTLKPRKSTPCHRRPLFFSRVSDTTDIARSRRRRPRCGP